MRHTHYFNLTVRSEVQREGIEDYLVGALSRWNDHHTGETSWDVEHVASFDSLVEKPVKPTTFAEKLAWLQANTCSFSIEVNDHRGVYSTIADEFETAERLTSIDEETKAECLRRDQLVVVQCYPSTPVGFYCVAHYDLETAVSRVYEAARKELDR